MASNLMDTTRVSLLIRIRDDQNRAAWQEFDSIYRPMIKRFAKTRGLVESEIDDLVQHCMVAIHRHIASFDYDPQKGKFKGWLRTMVHNRVQNLFRDRREKNADTAVFDRVDPSAPTPEETFDRVWMEEHLRHCLSCLKHEVEPSTYEAFRRYVIEEESVETVCAALEMNPDQLYKIKWRVTKRLAEMMRDFSEEK